MSRVTRKQLQAIVDGLNKELPGNFILEYAACYGGYVVEDAKGHRLTSERNNAATTAKILWAYRDGIRAARAIAACAEIV